MKKLVTIGGGSGSYAVLQGVKDLEFDISAIVTMFDSGGSSGVLRDELGMLPPGDVRRCLVALSDEHQQKILRDLFNFRFDEKGSVSGHSFGNLFLAALASIYGSDIEAIRKASELLNIKGKVLPVSLDKAHVHAVLESGEEIQGENNIDVPKHDGSMRIDKVYLSPPAHIFEETDAAIREADIIVIGPGDLYTSILPNIIVDGVPEALRASKAKKVVICNLMTKWGETHGFKASDMVKEVLKYSGLEKVDYAICNTHLVDEGLVAAYAEHKQYPMPCDPELDKYAINVIKGDFFSESDIARHDAEKTAKAIAAL